LLLVEIGNLGISQPYKTENLIEDVPMDFGEALIPYEN
jgi:hypothetical protein